MCDGEVVWDCGLDGVEDGREYLGSGCGADGVDGWELFYWIFEGGDGGE